MKEVVDSEYAISQKLAYETGARRRLDAEIEAVLKSLQSDQITIVGYEVELNDLKREDHVWFEDRWMVASLCDEYCRCRLRLDSCWCK
jgi:hypothetical protein